MNRWLCEEISSLVWLHHRDDYKTFFASMTTDFLIYLIVSLDRSMMMMKFFVCYSEIRMEFHNDHGIRLRHLYSKRKEKRRKSEYCYSSSSSSRHSLHRLFNRQTIAYPLRLVYDVNWFVINDCSISISSFSNYTRWYVFFDISIVNRECFSSNGECIQYEWRNRFHHLVSMWNRSITRKCSGKFSSIIRIHQQSFPSRSLGYIDRKFLPFMEFNGYLYMPMVDD